MKRMNLETAKEIKQSLLWEAIVGELDARVAYETTKLKTCSPDELVQIQAKVACYEALTRLPNDVIEREQ